MHHLILCTFSTEQSANRYDLAVEQWMLTCANITCRRMLQAEITPRSKFPGHSHFMDFRWCMHGVMQPRWKLKTKAELMWNCFFLSFSDTDPNINPFEPQTSEHQRLTSTPKWTWLPWDQQSPVITWLFSLRCKWGCEIEFIFSPSLPVHAKIEYMLCWNRDNAVTRLQG